MSLPDLPPVVNHPVPAEDDASRPAPQHDGIRHNRPLIFAILFGVTGALGLPLLWRSPVFTTREKWWWSAINILYTLGLLAIAVASIMFIMQAISQLP